MTWGELIKSLEGHLSEGVLVALDVLQVHCTDATPTVTYRIKVMAEGKLQGYVRGQHTWDPPGTASQAEIYTTLGEAEEAVRLRRWWGLLGWQPDMAPPTFVIEHLLTFTVHSEPEVHSERRDVKPGEYTLSGRITKAKPNLQNIPIRTSEGRRGEEK